MREVLTKMTGVLLFGLMTMVVTLKHPAFIYCPCMESLMLVDCDHSLVIEDDTGSSADCCQSVPREVQSSESSGDSERCSVNLEFDLGDYFSSGHSIELTQQVAEISSNDARVFPANSVQGLQVFPIRAGPPISFSEEPLFVRYSVYRI